MLDETVTSYKFLLQHRTLHTHFLISGDEMHSNILDAGIRRCRPQYCIAELPVRLDE